MLMGLAEIGTIVVLYFIFCSDVRRRLISFLKESPSLADSATRLCGIEIIMMFLSLGAFAFLCYLGESGCLN
jgi:hypothetical protein